MRTMRFGALAVAAALVMANTASAQAQPRQPGGRPGAGALITPEGIEQLKLSSDQKDKVEKIVKDYAEKARGNTEKIRELLQKARDGGDAATEARTQMRELQQANQKSRTEAVAAINVVLNDEQKKKFEEIQQRRRTGPGGGFPGGFGGFQPGQLLPARIQQQLDLTADQKEKLEKLQKDVESQLKKILTEEQNKKLDELKQGPGTRPRQGQPGNVQPRQRDARPARPARPATR